MYYVIKQIIDIINKTQQINNFFYNREQYFNCIEVIEC